MFLFENKGLRNVGLVHRFDHLAQCQAWMVGSISTPVGQNDEQGRNVHGITSPTPVGMHRKPSCFIKKREVNSCMFLKRGRTEYLLKARFLKLTTGLLSLCWVATASAQMVLEEIVVTAQKRKQSLQDVPISVHAVEGKSLENIGILRLDEMSSFVPNLAIKEGIASETIHMRGVGSGINAGFEQSVGTFVDGVYFGRAKQSLSNFLDVERIEVLKGPQTTYFGNNSIAGALNITTRKPGNTWEGFIDALYAEDGEYNIDVATGGPVSDTLGIRLAGKFGGSDGYLRDPFNDRDAVATDNWVSRVTFVWTPSENLNTTLKLENSEAEQDGNNFQVLDCFPPSELLVLGGPSRGCAVLAFNPSVVPNFEDQIDLNTWTGGGIDASFPLANSPPAPSVFDQEGFRTLEAENYALTLNYQLGNHTLTSVTGYTAYEFERLIDFDGTPSAQIDTLLSEAFDQVSQELRFSSPEGETFEYMVGAYYEKYNLNFLQNFMFRLPLSFMQPPLVAPDVFVSQPRDHDLESESQSAFGALTWNITNNLKATFGLRYVEVSKDVTHTLTMTDMTTGAPYMLPQLGLIPFSVTDDYEDDNISGSINIQWDVSDDVMLYTSYSEGFKAGGFNAEFQNPQLFDTFQFDAETVEAIEVGAKTRWMDSRLSLNGALFYNEFSDLQVSARNGTDFVTGNAAATISQGLELETVFLANDNLSLGLSLALLDAYYDNFANAACDPYAKAALIQTNPAVNQFNVNFVCDQDLGGVELQFSPDWDAAFTVNYSRPLTEHLDLVSSLNVNMSDDYQVDGANDRRLVQDSPSRVNLRIGVGTSDGQWEIAFIGRNLTDERIVSAGGELRDGQGSLGVSIERPRSLGVRGRFNW